jgi:hypothetical protein
MSIVSSFAASPSIPIAQQRGEPGMNSDIRPKTPKACFAEARSSADALAQSGGGDERSCRHTGKSLAEIRRLAVLLDQHPVPHLTKRDIQKRWSVGKDTVRKVLRANGVDPGRAKGLLIPITDVMFCEGISVPWVVPLCMV